MTYSHLDHLDTLKNSTSDAMQIAPEAPEGTERSSQGRGCECRRRAGSCCHFFSVPALLAWWVSALGPGETPRTGVDPVTSAPAGEGTVGLGLTVPRSCRDGLPAHVGSLAQRAYWALLSQQRDQSIVALGWSGAGKTTCCEQVLEHLVGMAGSVDGRVSVEKIRATFTVLRAFGSVFTGHSRRATRFSMVMSLDFNTTGRVTAAQLQTMLLEKSHVARQLEEGNFEVFSQMLAGLDLDLSWGVVVDVCCDGDILVQALTAAWETELYLHQLADSSSFSMGVWPKPEGKQRAAAAFAQLQGAMETLGVLESEQRAIWRVLAAIYHLGAAGACKGAAPGFSASTEKAWPPLSPITGRRKSHSGLVAFNSSL
ncbi:unconventional myosin-XVIIIb-like [Balaenoptera acutorostrata]|uniref:Unconventional myosin-XVIIIb-like n=1 Tax=Balaenoptera acutorostrata TaxID=9767 RepID=A0ABM3RX62_BALAC|nr:unconventional myosin-XVIIIb-like [Balaenoptera acutorostrata]